MEGTGWTPTTRGGTFSAAPSLGAQLSLAVGFVGAGVSMIIGIIYGLTSGYSSARTDNFTMRFVDFLYALPLIIFVILMQVFFKAQARHVGQGGH